MVTTTTSTAVFKNSTATSIEYRPAIDGLRAVAVLAVIFFHLNRRCVPGGFVGVDIFFVISGFLITSIIIRESEQNRFSLPRFYQRRVARLLPSFVAMAATTLVAASFVFTHQDLASVGATLAAAGLSGANFKFMLQGNYFTISPDAQPLLHCWSLSVEEQFYLLFPALFLVLSCKSRRLRTPILIGLCGLSLLSCIALTHFRASWAFYLLPSRAWELLAGSIFASLKGTPSRKGLLAATAPLAGISLIIVSLFALSEGQAFPGYLATLPVAGTCCFFLPLSSNGPVEKMLSWRPLVTIGKMSYSLYLWHWPLFSFVDYGFYWKSALYRLALKVALTVFASTLCYVLIEKPSRVFLNRPSRRKLAFAFLGCSLGILIAFGLLTRNANYVSATMGEVDNGGVHFNRTARQGSVILMGDSNASMYGVMMRNVARELGLRLTVISVDGGNPLPASDGESSSLWKGSLAIVRRQRPDFVVLACLWTGQLKGNRGKIQIALSQLEQFAHHIVLITQPPFLPKEATREGIRHGNRPPFKEDPKELVWRMEANRFVESLQDKRVSVINIEHQFSDGKGGIRFTDDRGRQLYQDNDHLSGVGAHLVESSLVKTIVSCDPNLR